MIGGPERNLGLFFLSGPGFRSETLGKELYREKSNGINSYWNHAKYLLQKPHRRKNNRQVQVGFFFIENSSEFLN